MVDIRQDWCNIGYMDMQEWYDCCMQDVLLLLPGSFSRMQLHQEYLHNLIHLACILAATKRALLQTLTLWVVSGSPVNL